MPRAGGVYTLPAGNPVVTLTVISSAWANTTMSDIATALTGSVPTDGSAPMTGALRLVDGAVGTPGLTWATETTSGWYRVGANSFGFSVGGVNALSVNANRGWNIPAPIAGATLTITAGGANALVLNGSGSGNEVLTISQVTDTRVGIYASGVEVGVIQGIAARFSFTAVGAGTSVTLNSNNGIALLINSTGNATINAPSSGTTLVVTAIAGGNPLSITDGTVNALVSFGGATLQLGTISNHPLTIFTNNSTRVTISGAGNVTIAAPTATSNTPGGFGLTVGAPTTANNSFGLLVGGGTSATDRALVVNNAAQSVNYFQIFGDGGALLAAATGGDQGLGTLNATGLFVNGVAGAPQNSQAAAYQLVLADAGKSIYHPAADAARIWTIPANSTVAFPIGTMVSFDNDISAGSITISITTDTLVFVPSGTTGSRILANGGQATARKITATRWMISGVGLT